MIKNFKKDCLDAIMDIWLETNIKTHDYVDKAYWQDNYDLVREILPEATVFVYEANGTIKGFTGLA